MLSRPSRHTGPLRTSLHDSSLPQRARPALSLKRSENQRAQLAALCVYLIVAL
jgi:hypothetical protein